MRPTHRVLLCLPLLRSSLMGHDLLKFALLACCWAYVFQPTPSSAADGQVQLFQIHAGNLNEAPTGKEVDWIYGDYVLRNDHITVVIGEPVAGRNANMTVRGVGGCIVDLTRRQFPNDQLSAFYPAGARYLFEDKSTVAIQVDGKPVKLDAASPSVSGSEITWSCKSSSSVSGDNSICTLTYRLNPKLTGIEVTVNVQDEAGKPFKIAAFDSVRADRTFVFEQKADDKFATIADDYFCQAYAIASDAATKYEWSKDRLRRLSYRSTKEDEQKSAWTTTVTPGSSVLDLRELLSGEPTVQTRIAINDPQGGVGRALIRFKKSVDGQPVGELRTNDAGECNIRLATGTWFADIEAIGYPATSTTLNVTAANPSLSINLPSPSRLDVVTTDDKNQSIPCKATIYGTNGTKNPDFGPDTLAYSAGNCVYAAHGKFSRSLPPGTYDVYISYGPEYDIEQKSIDVKAGEAVNITAKLRRSVDTSGWVSAELHSHSSPSGDNTCDQRARVLNLLCEQLEFCPCTEHNRIDSYSPHLEALKVAHLMATCTGMELTGSDLPINHQNAFPLRHYPHTQDGGGPKTDDNPAVQIERLAMWDGGSNKVVQSNHPDLRRIYRELDKAGNPMPDLKKMLGFMDVVEVHPPAGLFSGKDADNTVGDPPNRILRWMQLLNLGHRIPAVVNTDAHYAVHGSGWLRNWFYSSTDDPAKVDVNEMIHSAEHGNIICSTGPFLEVKASSEHEGQNEEALPGDDLIADRGEVTLQVKIQCPNWFDVDRVQVFVNGVPVDELNFTRKSHPDMFGDETVKFDEEIKLTLEEDSHVIVATIGESKQLGPVYGETNGKLQPVAFANPVYVDLDGDGFNPNRGDLNVGIVKP